LRTPQCVLFYNPKYLQTFCKQRVRKSANTKAVFAKLPFLIFVSLIVLSFPFCYLFPCFCKSYFRSCLLLFSSKLLVQFVRLRILLLSPWRAHKKNMSPKSWFLQSVEVHFLADGENVLANYRLWGTFSLVQSLAATAKLSTLVRPISRKNSEGCVSASSYTSWYFSDTFHSMNCIWKHDTKLSVWETGTCI